MEGSSEEVHLKELLHTNLVINSAKQHSAQGSVFYCKYADNKAQECVLKIYKSNDFKAFDREIRVFN